MSQGAQTRQVFGSPQRFTTATVRLCNAGCGQTVREGQRTCDACRKRFIGDPEYRSQLLQYGVVPD